MTKPPASPTTPVEPGAAQATGLRAHAAQFGLLVLINAFVGGMVGLERTVLPLVAEADFGIASRTATAAFIATFGLTKAVMNLAAGGLAEHWGRRRLLIAGWLVGLPVPLLIMFAPSWSWILVANVLLGVNQALTWSMTVVMKVDLARPRERGLALGLNEFAGYAGLSAVALATGAIAARTGLRPEPFYLGVALAVAGLALSLLVRETHGHVHAPASGAGARLPLAEVARRVSWRQPALASASLAGLATNLKDGALWGLLPLLLVARGLDLPRVATVVALYPLVWAFLQPGFGPLSDRLGRTALIVPGMAFQGIGVAILALTTAYPIQLAAAAVVGVGTAMVYPTLLALVSDVAAPAWRASALGVYRFWRDAGYAAGALGAGLVADAFGIPAALVLVAALTLVAAVAVATHAGGAGGSA